LKGNHELFPKHPDGSRDIVHSHSHITTWKSMEKLLATGKTKAIGVSNYSKRYLEQLLPEATVVPAVNQIENHPSLPQQEIVDFCKEKGIHITAYSPLGSTGSPLFTAEPIVAVAKKRGVSPASVLLSWHSTFPFASPISLFACNPLTIIYCNSRSRIFRSRQVRHTFSY
jgi:glycerol 2-dehydrogenase (NADP+)